MNYNLTIEDLENLKDAVREADANGLIDFRTKPLLDKLDHQLLIARATQKTLRQHGVG